MTQLSKRVPVVYGDNTQQPGVRVYIGPTDPISDLPVTVDLAHHQLHEGETHQYTYPPAALSSGSSVDVRFVVGNLVATKRTPHFVIEAGNKVGGASRESIEWDLKANTVYLIRATSKATGNNVAMRLMWYEDLGV